MDGGHEVRPGWRAQDVTLVLPLSEARALWDRAPGAAGTHRFIPDGDALEVWSGASRIGLARLWWGAPTDAHATLYRLEWSSGNEGELRRALEGLAGQPMPEVGA